MKKLAAIDIGTNSMRILIAETKNGQMVKRTKDLNTTRIGQNVDQTKQISEEAINRNIKALKEFVSFSKKLEVQKLSIIATSAVRDATNREEFIKRAKKESGVNIEVISGKREAELGFLGVCMGTKNDHKNILVIDIGGGSTEFIFGDQKGIKHLESLNMGAVRMTEKFVKKDIIDDEAIQQITEFVDQMLISMIEIAKSFSIDKVIGIGGTVTTLAAIHKELKIYDSEKVHDTVLSHKEIKDMVTTLVTKSLEERRQIQGLQPKRADIIPAGAIILDRILTVLNRDCIQISEYDNLEGIIFEQI